MRLSHITIQGFKSFAKKTTINVTCDITGVVGPNGSGKSNIAEAIRFVLGEQSMKSMRGKIGSDFIFKGSLHLSPMSRASVTMVIDNKEKIDTTHISEGMAPYLVYDEIVLSRIIYADGTSDYMLNDAVIRLKDVQELLSFAGIGGRAHTIISQGEADRILLASPADKKRALEDALGLRVFHIRLEESKRKLEKVKAHVHEVELLRKEILPHLTHLKRQVQKIESQEEERKHLHLLLNVYLTREEKELKLLNERILEQGTSSSLLVITESIRKELAVLKQNKHDSKADTKISAHQEKQTLQAELQSLSERRDQVTKTLGRLEVEKRYIDEKLENNKKEKLVSISGDEFSNTYTSISNNFEKITQLVFQKDLEGLVSVVKNLKDSVDNFFGKYNTNKEKRSEDDKNKSEEFEKNIKDQISKEKDLREEIRIVQEKINSLENKAHNEIISLHEEEKKVMVLESKLRELESTIALRKQEEGEYTLRKQMFDSLLEEGLVVVGRHLLSYKEGIQTEKYITMPKQELLRAIERSKLRIEEAGVPNREEVISEYRTTQEREEYLTKELTDIMASEEKLLVLIDELTISLEKRFGSGLIEVSRVFNEFFGEIFEGGKGKLSLSQTVKIDDDGNEKTEQGLDIDVSLPNKKVKEINMFSGGERALVAISLLFAMSSITPPPFIVLDETDAPLDEANAKKYGVMLKRLSEKSKLLVITHNRETMNHCDMLYGVTIGVEGASKLLSINFKEAENYTK